MFEDTTFEIDCPKCNQSITVRAGQVGKSIVCPSCKSKIEIKDNGFTDKLKDSENQINHLFDGFGK